MALRSPRQRAIQPALQKRRPRLLSLSPLPASQVSYAMSKSLA